MRNTNYKHYIIRYYPVSLPLPRTVFFMEWYGEIDMIDYDELDIVD